MTERTSPTDAIERLSWVLNYTGDGPRSLNELSEKSDLSWATVRKYIQTIETIQKIAPGISIEEDGVHVGTRTSTMKELFEDPPIALMVYLLTQAEMEDDISDPISRDTCKNLSSDIEGVLDQLDELGWIETSENEIQITPTGMQVAGPARSEIINSKQDISGETLAIRRDGSSSIVALKDDLRQTKSHAEGSSHSSEEYHSWGDQRYNSEEEREFDGAKSRGENSFDSTTTRVVHP